MGGTRTAGAATTVDGVFAGMLDLAQVSLPENALYYLCGLIPFMQTVRSGLLERGVAPRDIQYEVFGPDLWQADLDRPVSRWATRTHRRGDLAIGSPRW
jgi:nitric oxide dioxygenase